MFPRATFPSVVGLLILLPELLCFMLGGGRGGGPFGLAGGPVVGFFVSVFAAVLLRLSEYGWMAGWGGSGSDMDNRISGGADMSSLLTSCMRAVVVPSNSGASSCGTIGI